MAVLHPLVHSNTSDLNEQRYSSTLTGEEFFLAEHQVAVSGGAGRRFAGGGVSGDGAGRYRTGLAPASARYCIGIAQYRVASPNRWAKQKQINLRLLANQPEQIEYEIYSDDGEQRTVHCQGSAQWTEEPVALRLDLDQLKRQMVDGDVEPAKIYAAFTSMGVLHECLSRESPL